MGGQPAQLLPEAVKPGETIDLRVDLTAPSAPGSYTGNWALKDNNGNLFGIGENGNEPLAVKIVVRMPAIPTST